MSVDETKINASSIANNQSIERRITIDVRNFEPELSLVVVGSSRNVC
jgi:hypothetical protein